MTAWLEIGALRNWVRIPGESDDECRVIREDKKKSSDQREQNIDL